MDKFAVILTLLFIGMGLKRIPLFPSSMGNTLNLFVMYISLPSLILLKIPGVHFSADLFIPMLMPWGMLLIMCGLILVLSHFLKWDRTTTGCLLLVIPLGNTSFLGIPIVQSFFGEKGIPYALIYDQLGSFLALSTYGSLILAIYGVGEKNKTPMEIMKKILFFPPFIALILSLVIKSFTYPDLVVSLLTSLSGTLVPLVMIAVGFQLKLQLDQKSVAPLSIGLSIKLILAPLIAFLLTRFLGLEGIAVAVSVFQTGMPPMVTAGAMAIMANLSPALAAALAGLGIIFSFITLPILYQFLS